LEEGSQYNSDNNNKNKPNIVFKIRAYRRTADVIENISSNVEEIYNKWKLKVTFASIHCIVYSCENRTKSIVIVQKEKR
jgi:DNA polymerase/3'-5' exonuclease PolX